MEKLIELEIKLDIDNDEFGNRITVKGFDKGKPLQNTIELIGLLEIIKQQELKRFFKKEVKG